MNTIVMRFGRQFFRVAASLILLSIGALLAIAQPPADCPTISVTGPAGIAERGDWMEFTATVSNNVPPGVTYRWTISDGGGTPQGQGTLRLRVRAPQQSSYTITATLEVIGLPVGCPNSVSETAAVTCACDSILIDEFPRLSLRKQAERLDNAVIELRKSTANRLYFIEYFPPRVSDRVVEQRVAWISDQLRQRKLLPADFEIVTSGSTFPYALTKIYVVPPGADNPAP